MYLDDKGAVIKDASVIGPRAAGVPGTVAGLWAAHQRYGTRAWRELLQPAITLARDGFVPSKAMAGRIQEARGSYAGVTNFDRYFGQVQAGTLFRQPELAATLERIAATGAEGFYHGPNRAASSRQMQHGGLITVQDLAGYRVKWREPLDRGVARHDAADRAAAQLRRVRADRAAARCTMRWRRSSRVWRTIRRSTCT